MVRCMDTQERGSTRIERTGEREALAYREERGGVLTIADVAECGCPDLCDLDHDN